MFGVIVQFRRPRVLSRAEARAMGPINQSGSSAELPPLPGQVNAVGKHWPRLGGSWDDGIG